MKVKQGVENTAIQDVYSGPEMQLWELLMGRQIHLGGAESTNELVGMSGVVNSSCGVDLCCCAGEGMRYLIDCCGVKKMTGVDMTENVLQLARQRSDQAGLADSVSFVHSEAIDTNLPGASADFVWGEDAWCYVNDKPALIAEAVRLAKAGGTIAFSDWMEGQGMSSDEAERFMGFMKFPNLITINEYSQLLEDNDCEIKAAQDTGRFASCVSLYLEMLKSQHRYDALKILGGDKSVLDAVIGEMEFIHSLAESGKIMQGMVVARKDN